ncbi:MAG: FAD-dependent oxidoreductase [Alphaproteobacteria bacterium]
MGVTRRNFLNRLGAVAEPARCSGLCRTMGLLATEAAARPLALPANCGAGSSVVILARGMRASSSAYELERAGFKVTLIEARERVGGRNWTIRGGARVQNERKKPIRSAPGADGMYFNAGPARLPSHHQGVLDYAKAWACRWRLRSTPPLILSAAVQRRADAPAHGDQRYARTHLRTCLAKAINKGALDQDMTVEEKQRLMPFLKAYGDLADDMTF